MNKKFLGGVTLTIFSGLLFGSALEVLPSNLTGISTTASAKTKVRYYQNIKNATYTIKNKKAVVYTTAKLTHKKSARLGSMGPKVTGYYAAHVTKNGKKSVYYKFKTSYGSTGWVWNGWLKKAKTTTIKTKPVSNNTPATSNNSVDTSKSTDDTTANTFTLNQSEYVNAFLSELNQERAKRGLSALSLDSTLTQIATKRANDITTNFTHYDSNDNTFVSEYADQIGYSYSKIGEVLAQNYPTASSNLHNGETWGEDYDETSDTVTLPKNPTSSDLARSDVHGYIYDDAGSNWGHRNILLSAKYSKIGVAATYDSNNDKYSYTAADLSD